MIDTGILNIIFDCGQESETGKNSFKELANKKLDYLILTHPHKDHIAALNSNYYTRPTRLTRNIHIPQYLIDKQIQDANTYDKEIFRKYKQLNNDFTADTPNDISYCNPKNNGNVSISHFIPSKQNSDDLNDYSVATLLSYKEYKILLMGDNTPKNIEELMEDDDFKSEIENIDVLLAPHHGRESCYVQEFVSHLKPTLTIISDSSEIANESAMSKYEYYSSGMNVMKNGKYEFRKCVTTRNDGDITLTITDYGTLSVTCRK